MPPKISFLKLTQTDAVKRLYENNHIIQDMLVPMTDLKESLSMFDKEVKVNWLQFIALRALRKYQKSLKSVIIFLNNWAI